MEIFLLYAHMLKESLTERWVEKLEVAICVKFCLKNFFFKVYIFHFQLSDERMILLIKPHFIGRIVF